MGAAADFHGEITDGVNFHLFVVAAFEEGPGLDPAGFREGHGGEAHREIFGDFFVHHGLHGLFFFMAHGGGVNEVEAEALRGDVRAFLGHVVAENSPEGFVEQVGGGVISG